ncbi:hypothetical protein QAD02_004874 [Eretmocerus hayati]|uniref:Uncharacterized protein n=1 Tax=Eretmocerus hayati TaxID=131215 RepID=A0ACC2NR67_9HYME|nr:hypothetical protein QAD02_004874 [Eretmocerus hayati]
MRETLLLILAVAVGAQAFCYRKSPPRSQDTAESLAQPGNYSIWVCVQSQDLAADLEKAPKANTTQLWVSMSHVPKLPADAFAKLADKLVKIEIWSSKLAEIDDAALNGLKELKGLILPRNELSTIKAAWFKHTQKLLELNLANNKIASIEIDFLKSLPALINLDLRGNELLALPEDFVKQLPPTLRRLNIFNNPLNYRQTNQLAEYSKTKDDKTNEPRLKELKHVLSVTKSCLDDKDLSDKSNAGVDKCVEERMTKALMLIASGQVPVSGSTTSPGTTSTTVAGASSTTAKP